MINVVTGTLRERSFPQRFADPMPRMRPMGIHERWGGRVSARSDGNEFDDEDSVYLLTTNPQDEFAARSGVTQYVMVVSLALERLLRKIGLRLHRFGPPMHIERAMSVAVWLDVDLHARSMVPGQPIPLLAAAA